MKKSAVWALLTITLIFVAFVAGVYVGKNHNHTDVFLSATQPPSSSAQSRPTPSPSVSKPPESTASTGPAGSTPSVPVTPVFPININTATVEQLDLIPQIGPVLAARIVAYRTEYGNFKDVNELLHVSGIGEKTLAKILQYITV